MASIFSFSLAFAIISSLQLSSSIERRWLLEDRDRDRGDGTGGDDEEEIDPLLPAGSSSLSSVRSLRNRVKTFMRQLGVNLKRRGTRSALLGFVSVGLSIIVLIVSSYNAVLISSAIIGASVASFLIFTPHQI